MFIRGSGSFTHQQKEDNKTEKNPYADRGLDKFSTLLAELEHKRQRIYAQMGSDDISSVRFVYPGDSKKAKPIVVKFKNKNKNFLRHSEADKSSDEIPESTEMVVKQELENRYGKWNGIFGYCLGVIIVVMLVLLVIYGRVFAIIWATIGWYLVPMVVGRSRIGGKKRKRKVNEEPSCSENGIVP
ncbi:hypothetical protein CDL12_14950 [Handroanthus impetiginosus]|uniref:Uncharacterized protein n=1 Tax=Handroanthus impetiginosus TaxID=429701 RepID=A0A2G9H4J3_9LAMI|nr:hypothetical protein CDL12_14950 [Handroanthus impetiginosus]